MEKESEGSSEESYVEEHTPPKLIPAEDKLAQDLLVNFEVSPLLKVKAIEILHMNPESKPSTSVSEEKAGKEKQEAKDSEEKPKDSDGPSQSIEEKLPIYLLDLQREMKDVRKKCRRLIRFYQEHLSELQEQYAFLAYVNEVQQSAPTHTRGVQTEDLPEFKEDNDPEVSQKEEAEGEETEEEK